MRTDQLRKGPFPAGANPGRSNQNIGAAHAAAFALGTPWALKYVAAEALGPEQRERLEKPAAEYDGTLDGLIGTVRTLLPAAEEEKM